VNYVVPATTVELRWSRVLLAEINKNVYSFLLFADMSDEPAEIEGWSRQQVLGCGAFGVVTLWKNQETGIKIGTATLNKNN